MNGKKAKMLRKLAGPKSDTQYTVEESTIRGKFINVSPKINVHGKQVVDDDGNVVYNRLEWTTATIMMAAGTRMISKVLKNIYHNRTRNLHVNIHTPVAPAQA